MIDMARRTKKATPIEEPPAPKVLDANQVVAYNFRAARELRGWTQEETAHRLAPYIGQVLPKASISGIERSLDGERKRFFDAQELVAFSLTFDLPVMWFLLPPPGAADYQLAAAGRSLQLLANMLLGRDDQLEDIKERMRELRKADPESSGEVLAEAGGFPAELSWKHFQRSREEALFELVEEETSDIERLMGDLRRVVARFDDLSQRSHYASHPRKVYRAISHSLIGEAVFAKVLQTSDPADDGRYTLLRSRIPSPEAIETAVDLDDPEIVQRLAAVYDRAEELLQERLARRGRSRRRSAGHEDAET
jgi:transcriptional regulator with XRE-family HTH domain